MTDIKNIKHMIYTRQRGGGAVTRVYRSLIKQAVIATLRDEKVDVPCVVNVLITNGTGIRKYNLDFRGIDEDTDVLSFPMQAFKKAGWCERGEIELDEDTGQLPLGDIVISLLAVRKQAKEYGHSIERETTYLIIHSTLHLLGYDHNNRYYEMLMQDKEKLLLERMGYVEW